MMLNRRKKHIEQIKKKKKLTFEVVESPNKSSKEVKQVNSEGLNMQFQHDHNFKFTEMYMRQLVQRSDPFVAHKMNLFVKHLKLNAMKKKARKKLKEEHRLLFDNHEED